MKIQLLIGLNQDFLDVKGYSGCWSSILTILPKLRTSLREKIARNLYFYQKGAKIIITHGFIKKSRRTPKKEIEKAK